MKPEYDIKDIADNLRDMATNYVYATQKFDTQNLSVVRKLLAVCAIELLMGPDPHSGNRPHNDTIECLAEGLLARINVSNARPYKYASEPWREQDESYHARHAADHISTAKSSIGSDTYASLWLSDLDQPEAAHAAFRCDMLLWAHEKANEK